MLSTASLKKQILSSLLAFMSLYQFAQCDDSTWNYRGKVIESDTSTIYLADVQLSDDKLLIYYSVPDRNWYLEFRYIGDTSIVWNAGFQSPEFFARTNESLNFESGRYQSDFTIKNAFKVATEGNVEVVTMLLKPEDVQALQKYFVLGASYFVSDGGQRHYRFPPTGLAKAIQHIQLDIDEIPNHNVPFSNDRLIAADAATYRAIIRNFQFAKKDWLTPTLVDKPSLSEQQKVSNTIRNHLETLQKAQEADLEALRDLVINKLNGGWLDNADISIPAQYDCHREFSAILNLAKQRDFERGISAKVCEDFKKKHQPYDMIND